MQRRPNKKSAVIGSKSVVAEMPVRLGLSAARKKHLQATRLPLQGCKIDISIRDQRLTLKQGRKKLKSYPISSSRFGLGTKEGSMKTPLGKFRVSEKIGHGAPLGTIFKSRIALGPNDPLPNTDDFVTSRILWLDGL